MKFTESVRFPGAGNAFDSRLPTESSSGDLLRATRVTPAKERS